MNNKFKKIKAIICDVDGVLTSGSITFDANGNELKSFNVKDGQIVSHLKKMGFILGAITGRDSNAVKNRCTALKLDFHQHGIHDKLKSYNRFKKEFNLNDDEIAYIGDDIIDLSILSRCGLSCSPSDAVPAVLSNVHFVSSKKGGDGVFRDVADQILTSQDKLDALIEKCISGEAFI